MQEGPERRVCSRSEESGEREGYLLPVGSLTLLESHA
jgi:hypothetical protein